MIPSIEPPTPLPEWEITVTLYHLGGRSYAAWHRWNWQNCSLHKAGWRHFARLQVTGWPSPSTRVIFR